MNNSEISGFVNIIKPTGMTSSDVVVKIKKILQTKKVGHLGTLDPAASGVLPVSVGRATKFFDYFLNKDKIYIAEVYFGKLTDTLDSYGEVLEKNTLPVSYNMIESVLSKFTGEIFQTPPKYSAIKINGKKACDLARENKNFEIKPRKINIYSIKLIREIENNRFLFKVHCSAGTYIRTLFNDIASAFNTFATTEAIIRVKSGYFDMETAITINELEQTKKVLSVQEIFSTAKTIDVNEDHAKKLINGVSVRVKELNANIDNNAEFFAKQNDKLIGFYKNENGMTKQIVYLY